MNNKTLETLIIHSAYELNVVPNNNIRYRGRMSKIETVRKEPLMLEYLNINE